MIQLQEIDSLRRKLTIVFRVFNDGVGFRYEIPEQENVSTINITNELTEFNLSNDMTAWFNPANFDSYEMGYRPVDDRSCDCPFNIHPNNNNCLPQR